jgi:hypothetical protein
MPGVFRCLLFVAIPLLPAAAQDALVEGSVMNRVSGIPVKRAHVLAVRVAPQSGGDAQEMGADTDAGGRFTLRLEPGSYRIWVDRPGFLRQNYGASSPNGAGRVLTLGTGQEMHDVAFRIAPLGAISGRVLDEDGEPLQGAGIDVLKLSYATGRRNLVPVTGVSVNDRGEYRAYHLPPGRYFLLATQRGEPLVRPIGKGTLIADAQEFYAPMYYPGVIDIAGAARLSLGEGQDLQDIDFRLQRVRVFTLRGHISSSVENFSESQLQVFLAPREGTMASPINRVPAAIDRAAGRFEFHRVAPGSYVLIASQLWKGHTLTGRLPVEVVNSDHQDELTVSLIPPFELTGTIQVEGAGAGSMQGARIQLTESEGLAGGAPLVARAAPNGVFQLTGVNAGFWDLTIAPIPPGAWVKTVEWNGRPVQAESIDLTAPIPGILRIVLAPNGARLSGTVTRDGRGCPGTVVLVPSPELRSFPGMYRTATASAEGSFEIAGIRPGTYKIIAFDEIEPPAWLDPEFLSGVESSAEEITLAEGDDAKRLLTAVSGDSPGARP